MSPQSTEPTFPTIPGLLLERHGSVAVLTIDRPRVRNSLTGETYAGLFTLWARLQQDDRVRAVVITGAQDTNSPPERQAFCSGSDLTERDGAVPLPDADVLQGGSFGSTENSTPVVAAVNGHCIGGGLTLMLASDLRVASQFATFGLPEVSLGMIPAHGGIGRALASTSRAVVMELLLLRQRIDAERAVRVGLVNAVVPPPEVLPTALSWAREIAALPPEAVRSAMDLVARTPMLGLEDSVRLETLLLDRLQGRRRP
jgi:E-phenylitaconyl-CoA hydratase